VLLYAEVIVGAFVLCIMLNIGLRKISKFSGVLLSKGISAIGGVSIWTGFCVASCWGLDELEVISSGPLVIIVTSFVMLVFGIFDDYKNFSVTVKFLTQIFSVTLLMFFGVSTKVVYIGPYFNALITLIWVIGIANAFNHLDISDGVAGVIGVLISSSFLIISILNHDKSNLIFSLALCGSLLGFFWEPFSWIFVCRNSNCH
jgi:UDP-GlcNAc:undecaprenyl-phosphate/decaprenyl-phosphate GlcNAc-1-phosphate transferase